MYEGLRISRSIRKMDFVPIYDWKMLSSKVLSPISKRGAIPAVRERSAEGNARPPYQAVRTKRFARPGRDKSRPAPHRFLFHRMDDSRGRFDVESLR